MSNDWVDQQQAGDELTGERNGAPRWRWEALGAVVVAILLVAVANVLLGGDDEPTVIATTLPPVTTTVPVVTTTIPGVFRIVVDQTAAPEACNGEGSASAAPIQTFVDAALAQVGDLYEFGAEVDLSDEDPAAFDTSELVEWSAAQAGVSITDGSWLQFLSLVDCDAELSVQEALENPGNLVFGFSDEPKASQRPETSFVAITIGDGERIIDVREGSGVDVYAASTRELTHGARIPNLGDGKLIDP